MDPTGRTYEDFVPPHSMVREPPTHTLSVDLSAAGYKKEHIRVQLVHSHRRLIVRGERPVNGNRWSRFRLEFKLPDDCDTKGIQARFEKGVVRVTIPGLTPELVAGGEQQKPAAVLQPAATTAAASGGVQDSDRPAALPAPAPGRGEELKQRVSSTKDGGNDGDSSTEGEEDTDADAPSPRQGYAFLQNRRKLATTLLGVVLVLLSLGFYIRYSFWP